jgi:membrane protein YqaA with SNARE-associated domain
MSFKQKVYSKLKALVNTPYGVFFMCLLAFLESCISPVTPLVMLIPMILIHQDKALRYVNLASLAALFGSVFGYILGYYLMLYIQPYIVDWNYVNEFQKVQNWFEIYGLLVLLPASILPFPPFKVFTIAAGAMHVPFIWFMVVVFIVRWLHFVIIPLMMYLGKKAYLYKYEDNLTG